jgi:hypothetical protein
MPNITSEETSCSDRPSRTTRSFQSTCTGNIELAGKPRVRAYAQQRNAVRCLPVGSASTGSAVSYDDTRLGRQVSTRVLQHETRAGVGSQAQDPTREHVTSNVPEVSTCTAAAFASMAQQLPLVT